MASPREIRRCALQALYQFDAGSADDRDTVRASLEGSPGGEAVQRDGFALAVSVWESRAPADESIARVATNWPLYRQPVIDRNILRLAHYEISSGRTPPKVAINEAVELAREFSTEKSPHFVNGVLDKIYRELREADSAGTREPEPTGEAGGV